MPKHRAHDRAAADQATGADVAEAPGGDAVQAPGAADAGAVGTGAWVVLPTYEEAENLPGICFAILAAVPGATLLVVDDNSPDGTGRIADDLAKREPRIRVRHRPGKAGIGRAYLDGFRVALEDRKSVV